MLEMILGLVAILIAIWQLYLQREEIKRNGKIFTMVHIANDVKSKIEQYEKIIADLKQEDKRWKGHADRINNELRPALQKINKQIASTSSKYQLPFFTESMQNLLYDANDLEAN